MKNNKLIKILSSVLFGYIIVSLPLSAQDLNIVWGLEQEYHKRGESQQVNIIHVDTNHLYYRVSAVSMLVKQNEFIVKHNRKTGENIYYDIKNSMIGYIPSHLAYLKDSDIHLSLGFINVTNYKTENYQEVLDTASMKLKNPREKVAKVDRLPGQPDLHSLTNINYDLIGNEVIYVATSDKNDNTYSTIRTYKDNNRKTKYLDSEFSIVCYPNNKEKPISLPLKLQENCFVTSCQLAVNENQEIICAVLYAKLGIGTAAGCFSFVISPLLSGIKSVSYKEFTQDFLAKGFETADFKYKNENIDINKEFQDNTLYKSQKIHFSKDGSYTIVFEKSKWELTSVGVGVNMGASTIRNDYYYGDIFVLKCNSDGSIKWTQKIPRTAFLIDKSYLGDYYVKYDDHDNMFVIYNLIDTSPAFKTITKSNTICVKLDKDGNDRFTVLEPKTGESKFIFPGFSYDLGGDSVLIVKNAKKSLLPGTGASVDKLIFGELKLK